MLVFGAKCSQHGRGAEGRLHGAIIASYGAWHYPKVPRDADKLKEEYQTASRLRPACEKVVPGGLL